MMHKQEDGQTEHLGTLLYEKCSPTNTICLHGPGRKILLRQNYRVFWNVVLQILRYAKRRMHTAWQNNSRDETLG
jgi:hypothetical protein